MISADITADELERRIKGIVQQVLSGASIEDDSSVELKAGFIDPHEMAYRIAGHANTAQSVGNEVILWLIGVDEKKRLVRSVGEHDLAEEWSRIESVFDGEPPALINSVALVLDG